MGALQISSALKDVGAITQQDLAEFASDRVPGGVKQNPVAYGDFYGISAEYFKDESFWKEWWLKKGPLLVYVTYNVGKSHRHDEIEDVERILNSLKSLLP